jgi:hypothetical protein
MSSYTLAGILAQQIPDHLILDIALHLQANDNRCASQQARQVDSFFDRPPHQPDKAMARPGRSSGGPRWLPPSWQQSLGYQRTPWGGVDLVPQRRDVFPGSCRLYDDRSLPGRHPRSAAGLIQSAHLTLLPYTF